MVHHMRATWPRVASCAGSRAGAGARHLWCQCARVWARRVFVQARHDYALRQPTVLTPTLCSGGGTPKLATASLGPSLPLAQSLARDGSRLTASRLAAQTHVVAVRLVVVFYSCLIRFHDDRRCPPNVCGSRHLLR
jgi:hypothetical protein